MKTIPLFRPSFHVDEAVRLVKECLEIGWTGIGYRTEQFEQAWSAHTGSSYSHFLNSSTSGLNLAVHILSQLRQWPSAAEIITTPLTFVSTNHAILHSGCKPIFADCDPSGCLDLDSIKACITPQTRCVIYVGLGGNYAQLPEIHTFCKSLELDLIVDAAHMAGSRYDGCCANAFGTITIYSFQAVKNLPTGDSGMLCTDDPEIDLIARRLSWLGIDKDTYQRSKEGSYKWDYDVPDIGYKYHGNSIMASIALAQLSSLDADNLHRRHVAAWYRKYLDLSSLQLLEHRNEDESSRHLVQICVDRRDELMQYLESHGIATGVHYKDNTLYRMYASCPSLAVHARSLWTKLVSLPCHLDLEESDIAYISSTVNSFFKCH
jgi:dTDP-4-amino-4,6-dideoxygalactose transaminase